MFWSTNTLLKFGFAWLFCMIWHATMWFVLFNALNMFDILWLISPENPLHQQSLLSDLAFACFPSRYTASCLVVFFMWKPIRNIESVRYCLRMAKNDKGKLHNIPSALHSSLLKRRNIAFPRAAPSWYALPWPTTGAMWRSGWAWAAEPNKHTPKRPAALHATWYGSYSSMPISALYIWNELEYPTLA